ncbi:MMPL family transporter [Halocatena salina]|uniref:MMPL family transporter n=1 Tax=Halocatena salina TaxID=2934340 RepID=A0A8U0A3B7_9EURY|nr:MMPL family transporter [Halocatena salina]UPM43592.1 MMPL family transporter [Halocatena salina]
MGVLERLSAGVTRYRRPVIVALLLMTVVMGAGAPMITQSSSLDSFQSDTGQAAQAEEYISENFTSQDENATSVQIIVRDDNVLSKESLLRQLRLQRALKNNSTINGTLANDSTVGVASVVSTAAVQMDRAESLQERGKAIEREGESLQERGKELQQRSESLNESREELQQRSEQLKQDGNELQERGQALQERADELNQSRAELQADPRELKQRADELNQSRAELQADSRELKQRADELNQSRAELQADSRELKQRADELNQSRAELNQRRERLEQRADELNETRDSLEERAKNITAREKQLAEDRRSGDVPPSELEQRREQLERDERELANDTITLKQRADELESDRAALERDGQALKERARKLNQSRNELQNRSQKLQEQGQQLKADREKLEQRGQQLEERGQQLKADREKLEQRGQQLEERGQQLKADREKLEQRKRELEQRQQQLENDAQELNQSAKALQNDSEALKSDREALEQKVEQLEADRNELQNNETQLSITKQIDVLESRNRSEITTAVDAVLGGNSTDEDNGAFAFMPSDYDPGDDTANATMVVVTQSANGTSMGGTTSERLVNSQLAIEEIAHENYDSQQVSVFGAGVITDEIERSMTDSLAIVGPLALVFVLIVLVIAYRDLLDILLGLFGIGVVLVWTFGFMGWAGIAFNQIFIAVPVLLIGLSIDYAIHVFMRHRESREHVDGIRHSMRSALSGIAVALVLVTLTAVIGFLSNLTSSVPPIREFGIVSAVGISAALLVFGLLIPALKVEFDSLLEARGWDRHKRAVGTGGGTLGSLLAGGATAARRAPHVVVLIALLLTVAGGVGASQVDTSFAQEDFLADDPDGWMESLPEPFAPGEYTAKESMSFVNDRFVREDSSAALLIQGNVTDPKTMTAIDRAEQNASDKEVTATLSNGDSDIMSPLSAMEDVAAQNESFNQTFTDADTDGDGVPDRNLDAVYDSLYETAPDTASSVIQRTDDEEYEALHMTVSIDGGAGGQAVTDQMRTVASSVEETDHLQATATGQPIVFKNVQDQLLRTVIESLLITLGVTFVFLMFVYRYLYGSASLGFVTMLPVGFSVSWILGTMYLLDIPFNVITGLITSLTVGLGIAYSIHLSERYSLELDDATTAWEALETAVTGTGGALLGSAATTVGGFGVLAFAILPPLQQFGIITGLTIIYAFLASVVVLPSLLVLWTRWFGPGDAFETTSTSFGTTGEEAYTDD